MSKNRIIESMIVDNIPVLYVNDNAYVADEVIKNNSIISKMVAGAEAFAYDFISARCVDGEQKKEADKEYAGKYVVRYIEADKPGNKVAFSL